MNWTFCENCECRTCEDRSDCANCDCYGCDEKHPYFKSSCDDYRPALEEKDFDDE